MLAPNKYMFSSRVEDDYPMAAHDLGKFDDSNMTVKPGGSYGGPLRPDYPDELEGCVLGKDGLVKRNVGHIATTETTVKYDAYRGAFEGIDY